MPEQVDLDKPQPESNPTNDLSSIDFGEGHELEKAEPEAPEKELPPLNLGEDETVTSETKPDKAAESVSGQQPESVQQVSEKFFLGQKPLTGSESFLHDGFAQYAISPEGDAPKTEKTSPVTASKPKKKRWIRRIVGFSLLVGGGIYGVNQINPDDAHVDLSSSVRWAQMNTKDIVTSVEKGVKNIYNSSIVASARARIAGEQAIAQFIKGKPIVVSGHFNRGVALALGKDYCRKVVVVAAGQDGMNDARGITNLFEKAGMRVDVASLNAVNARNRGLRAGSVYGFCLPR